jgi:hypothetical protein
MPYFILFTVYSRYVKPHTRTHPTSRSLVVAMLDCYFAAHSTYTTCLVHSFHGINRSPYSMNIKADFLSSVKRTSSRNSKCFSSLTRKTIFN